MLHHRKLTASQSTMQGTSQVSNIRHTSMQNCPVPETPPLINDKLQRCSLSNAMPLSETESLNSNANVTVSLTMEDSKTRQWLTPEHVD